jgi:hypothetical protein
MMIMMVRELLRRGKRLVKETVGVQEGREDGDGQTI